MTQFKLQHDGDSCTGFARAAVVDEDDAVFEVKSAIGSSAFANMFASLFGRVPTLLSP